MNMMKTSILGFHWLLCKIFITKRLQTKLLPSITTCLNSPYFSFARLKLNSWTSAGVLRLTPGRWCDGTSDSCLRDPMC